MIGGAATERLTEMHINLQCRKNKSVG